MRISDWSSDVCSSDLIDLPGIAADHHPAVFAKTGQEHLHLRGGRVLRFIQDDECIDKSAVAHEGEGRNLDLSAGDAALHLLGRQGVIERVIERAEIGIDLVLHVAGKKTRSEEHTSELQSLMRISYAVF